MPKPEDKPGATPGGPGVPATPPGREENPGKGHDKDKPVDPDEGDTPEPRPGQLPSTPIATPYDDK